MELSMNRGIFMKDIIIAKNVSKAFKLGYLAIEVLKNVDINIKVGEFVSIMGPSGSGKSTLLYLLGGLDKPTSGEILIENTDITNLKDRELSLLRRRYLGFVFQFYNLIPNLTVEENIMVPVLLDGGKMNQFTQTLDEILDIVGLADRRKHTPRELSGGQQQRVAIARALINSPEIILADEPTGNLDSKTGDEIMELFTQINKYKGKTIVQVTHSDSAAQYSDRTIRIIDGRIE
jgi:putative ABC transport system ATP-binding protein